MGIKRKLEIYEAGIFLGCGVYMAAEKLSSGKDYLEAGLAGLLGLVGGAFLCETINQVDKYIARRNRRKDFLLHEEKLKKIGARKLAHLENLARNPELENDSELLQANKELIKLTKQVYNIS